MERRNYAEDTTSCVIAWITAEPTLSEAARLVRDAAAPEAAAKLAAWTRDRVLGRAGDLSRGSPGRFQADLAAIALDGTDWDHVARALRIIREGEDWIEEVAI